MCIRDRVNNPRSTNDTANEESLKRFENLLTELIISPAPNQITTKERIKIHMFTASII